MEIPSFFFYSVNNELESFQLLFRAFPPSKPYTFNLFSNLYCLRLSSKIKQKFDTTRFPNFFLSSHQHQLKILSISSTLSITRSISRTNRENVRHERFHAFHDHWNETTIQWCAEIVSIGAHNRMT